LGSKGSDSGENFLSFQKRLNFTPKMDFEGNFTRIFVVSKSLDFTPKMDFEKLAFP